MLLSTLQEFQEQACAIKSLKGQPTGLQAEEAEDLHVPGLCLYPSAGPAWLSAPRHKQQVSFCLTALAVCGCTSTPPVKVDKVLPHLSEIEELTL